MKKVFYSDISPTALQPFTDKTFKYLQEAFTEWLDGICRGQYSDNFISAGGHYLIVQGCVDSGSGASWNISAGVVYDPSQKQCYLIPAFTSALIGGKVPCLATVSAFDAGDPLTFSDGNTHNVHSDVTAQWIMATPGSYAVDFTDNTKLKRVQTDWINEDMSGKIVAGGGGSISSVNSNTCVYKQEGNKLFLSFVFDLTITGVVDYFVLTLPASYKHLHTTVDNGVDLIMITDNSINVVGMVQLMVTDNKIIISRLDNTTLTVGNIGIQGRIVLPIA